MANSKALPEHDRPFRVPAYQWIPLVMWILAFAAIPVWIALCPGLSCDAKLYFKAIRSVHAGHDPYLDGIGAVTALNGFPHANLPYPYAYSPITLPLLRLLGLFLPMLYIGGYWLLYIAGALAQIWVSMQAAEPEERKYFAFLAPAAAFFPGLVQESTLMAGNIAYILYGLVFATALFGWRRGQWRWFYLATLAASCFKIPMLSLLAIPILSARKQWLPAGVTAASGVGLFAVQSLIWPSCFHHYLRVVGLVFSRFQNFGVGPAGIFGQILFDAGHSYRATSMLFYILFALPLFGLLLYLSRQYFNGKLSLEQWMPVMLTGVILLNPRIQEYDIAPLTVFMALILWRMFASLTNTAGAILFSLLFFAGINTAVILVAPFDGGYFQLRCIQGAVLGSIFIAGYGNLLWQFRNPYLNECAPKLSVLISSSE
jgi:hypothetical protein